jgi:hypothetical protein
MEKVEVCFPMTRFAKLCGGHLERTLSLSKSPPIQATVLWTKLTAICLNFD